MIVIDNSEQIVNSLRQQLDVANADFFALAKDHESLKKEIESLRHNLEAASAEIVEWKRQARIAKNFYLGIDNAMKVLDTSN